MQKGAVMHDRRQHRRHPAELQVDVFDQHSGRLLGRLADLSMDGFMLFGNSPHSVDSVLECRLVCAHMNNGINGISAITLGADCLWSRPGADGQHGWAGFHIIDLAEDQAAALAVLLEHL
jgi:hypothetical protein